MIHICSLAQVHRTVAATGARHLVTLLRDTDLIERPDAIVAGNHLILGVDDITVPIEGYSAPGGDHVHRLIAFVRGWDRVAPLLVHCFAGISRSTAAAYVTACALNPHRDELSIARSLRHASPTATPNARIVALADHALSRNGRMVAAIETIGPGLLALEAAPFRLELE
jgi:predicted protein tyrosine phosphatase